MYRLGQSSLPTEGTGPVVNLFTREVNDIRDGLFVDLDLVPRAARPGRRACCSSPCSSRRSSTIFLAVARGRWSG